MLLLLVLVLLVVLLLLLVVASTIIIVRRIQHASQYKATSCGIKKGKKCNLMYVSLLCARCNV
jgi:hypothetical protein